MRSELPEGWKQVAITEVADVVGGGTPKTKDPENFGGEIPWITPKDLSQHPRRGIEFGGRNITQKGLDSSSARLLPAGTVLVSSRAPIGYCAIAENPVTTNQGFRSLLLRDGHSPEFFYYLLSNNTELLESRASGSTFKEISGSTLGQTQFAIPEPPEQCRIGWVLGSLDDKIELNRRIAETLEQIAAAVFRARFVDFVGVEEFEDSEVGLIPKGWEIVPVGEAVKVVGGGTPSTKDPAFWEGGTHAWATPKDLSNHQSPILLDTSRHVTNAGIAKISSGLLPPETVLLSSRAPIGYTVISKIPVAVNQGFIAFLPAEHIGPEYILFWVRHNLDRIKSSAGGTTFAEISKRAFRPIPMIVPPEGETEDFKAVARPIMNAIALLGTEAATLTSLRDTLLPKLISGEIRVPEGFGPGSEPADLLDDTDTPAPGPGEGPPATPSAAAP